ncbi:MAG: GMP reductase [Spirochaetales bacterium]
MHLDADLKLDFPDVLIRPKRSTLESRKTVNLVREFKLKWSGRKIAHVPVIASNMATGSFAMARAFVPHRMLVALHKFHTVDDWKRELSAPDGLELLRHVWFTVGMSDDEYAQFVQVKAFAKQLYGAEAADELKLCIDIANGYTQRFAGFVKKIREANPGTCISAGNVATPEMVQELIISGADFVKVGIGPGSQCTTRLKTGIGYPQVSAAIECSDASHGLGAGIILDGGLRSPGDIAKAFCANADFVMMGGMFAGTDECEGELIERHYRQGEVELLNGVWTDKITTRKFKLFYGMSSEFAQEKHMAGMKHYRTSEGRVDEVAYKGPVEAVIDDILGGLRSTGTYIGARELKHFGLCATLVRVSRQHDRF